jgi:protein O-mannosyl-transferase
MKSKYIYIFGIIALTFLLYLPSLNNGFTNYDDDVGVTTNAALRDFSFLGIKNTFSTFTLGMYMPLTMLCYTILYQLSEYNAFAYHFFQVLIHLINILLVFRLIRKLNFSNEVALITAGFFALHPFQVESINWVAALSTPLYACFYLLAILQYLDFQQNKSKNAFIKSLLLMILACLSKSTAVTLTPVLLLFDFHLHRNLKSTKVWVEKIPFFVVSLFFGILTFYSRNAGAENLTIHTGFSIVDRFLMISHTICFYWLKLFLPTNLNLWYPFYKENGTWSWDYYVAPLLLLGLAYYVFFKAEKWRNILIFSILFYLFVIGLSLPLVKTGAMEMCSDRYNYLPCIGIFFLVGIFYNYLKDKKTNILYANITLLALTIFFAFQTFERSKIWENSITLFSDFIAKNPQEATPYYNRALAYTAEKKFALAEADFGKVGSLDSHYWGDDLRKGNCNMELKKYKEAIIDFDKSLNENVNQAIVLKNKGFCKIQLADYQGAIIDLEKSLTINDSNEDTYYNMGIAYGALKQTEKSKQNYEKATALNPKYTEAFINLGNLYAMENNFDEALKNYNKAIAITSVFPNVFLNRGRMLMEKKMYNEALRDFEKFSTLNPNDPRGIQMIDLVKTKMRIGS